jgi:hypothetical protein
MMTKTNARTSLHPSLMLTFIIVGLTGILLLFHIDVRGIKHLHEWMSVVFLILCIVHLSLNWKAFLVHFKKGPVALSVIGLGLLSVLLLFGASGGDGHGSHDRSGSGHYRHLKHSR